MSELITLSLANMPFNSCFNHYRAIGEKNVGKGGGFQTSINRGKGGSPRMRRGIPSLPTARSRRRGRGSNAVLKCILGRRPAEAQGREEASTHTPFGTPPPPSIASLDPVTGSRAVVKKGGCGWQGAPAGNSSWSNGLKVFANARVNNSIIGQYAFKPLLEISITLQPWGRMRGEALGSG